MTKVVVRKCSVDSHILSVSVFFSTAAWKQTRLSIKFQSVVSDCAQMCEVVARVNLTVSVSCMAAKSIGVSVCVCERVRSLDVCHGNVTENALGLLRILFACQLVTLTPLAEIKWFLVMIPGTRV